MGCGSGGWHTRGFRHSYAYLPIFTHAYPIHAQTPINTGRPATEDPPSRERAQPTNNLSVSGYNTALRMGVLVCGCRTVTGAASRQFPSMLELRCSTESGNHGNILFHYIFLGFDPPSVWIHPIGFDPLGWTPHPFRSPRDLSGTPAAWGWTRVHTDQHPGSVWQGPLVCGPPRAFFWGRVAVWSRFTPLPR